MSLTRQRVLPHLVMILTYIQLMSGPTLGLDTIVNDNQIIKTDY